MFLQYVTLAVLDLNIIDQAGIELPVICLLLLLKCRNLNHATVSGLEFLFLGYRNTLTCLSYHLIFKSKRQRFKTNDI